MIAAVPVMVVITTVMEIAAIVVAAVVSGAIWTVLPRRGAAKRYCLASHLHGIGHEQGSVSNPGASNLDAVTNAWQKTLIFQKSRRAQTNFRSGTAIL
jgi:hypothetical protein